MSYDKRALCERIEKLRAEGRTFGAIAQIIHVSRQTVQRIAATFGIQKRKWARVKMPTKVIASDGDANTMAVDRCGIARPEET